MTPNIEGKKKKARHIKLTIVKREGQNSMVAEHPYSGSFEPIHRFDQFADKLEALCGLPSRDELPRILEMSTTSMLPAIWRRARLSPLEDKAILIFSVLAFSSNKRWRHLLQQFFRYEQWQVDLRGRPKMDPRDEELRPVMRGLKIEKLIERLRVGHQLYAQTKRRGNFASGEEQITKRLEILGLDEQEREAIMSSRSLQDAACRCFSATQEGLHVSLGSVRNDYAKFKLLKRRFSDIGR